MSILKYNRKSILKGIIVAYFLLFFFSYFFFFIADNAMSGKVISEEKQINISMPEINLQANFKSNSEKLINFFILFGAILISILIMFYFSKFLHKKVTKEKKITLTYKPFKKIN